MGGGARSVNKTEVLKTLEKLGTAQNRKVYARHGVKGKMYGVSYANQAKLKKQIKTDHELALGLWTSGNHDARALATMIADPERADSRLLDRWLRDLDNYGITDAFAAFVKKTPLVKRKMEKWTRSKGEWTGQAGFQLLSHLAMQDETLTDDYLEGYLRIIESEIHGRKNRVRHSMNGALISIGLRNPKLRKKAIAAAKRIGKVEVDHGETSCKTPDAIPYIQRAVARRPTRGKRNP
jgi:3-methyladenine DNA glycosylase AlkD